MPSIDNLLTKRRKERTWENSRGSLINITEEEETQESMGMENELAVCLRLRRKRSFFHISFVGWKKCRLLYFTSSRSAGLVVEAAQSDLDMSRSLASGFSFFPF